jgi:hypothetical protein
MRAPPPPSPVPQTANGTRQDRADRPTTATDWPQRVADVLAAIPLPMPMPGFDPRTLLPTPAAFDEPIRSLEQTAATFEVMGGNLGEVLGGVRWQGNDATRFRDHFTGGRTPQLQSRAGDLRDLAGELRRIQGRTRDEIEWIRAIHRAAVGFLDTVEAAFRSAWSAATEALGDARQLCMSANDALQNAAGGAVDLARAGFDQLTGGDGLSDLVSAARHAEAVVGNAQQALDAVVDFTVNWTFNRVNLPQGVCRAWYDVDSFMASKSGTAEAYGVTYPARGPFAG